MAPFNSNPVVGFHSGFHNLSASPYAQVPSMQPEPQAQLNIEEEAEDPYWAIQEEWASYAGSFRDPQRVPHPSVCWYFRTKEEEKKKALTVPPPFTGFDASRWADAVQADRSKRFEWDMCHLLSLPKELRLMIWEYVLTDPSVPELVVGISREWGSPSLCPRVKIGLQPHRNAPINLALLRTNRFIYEEGLPLLYNSVRFAPLDLEGLFPLFLDSLSPVAMPLIRHVKLCIPGPLIDPLLFNDPFKPLFHWAITCAQVAKLNNTLRSIEIEGDLSAFETNLTRRALLYPLCKIKAPKKFSPDDHDAKFQELLAEAEQELKAKAGVREEQTKAEAAERARLEVLMQDEQKRREEERTSVYPLPPLPATPEATVDEGLSRVEGINQFKKELEEHAESASRVEDVCEAVDTDGGEIEEEIGEWDLVSLRSGASTPKARPASPMSERGDEAWVDTASTLVGNEEPADANEQNRKGN